MKENNAKNRIIALSGENEKEKEIIAKDLIEKLKKLGYPEEQIHFETMENEFSKYFNIAIDFICDLNNDTKLKEIKGKIKLGEFFSNEKYRQILAKTMANVIKEKEKIINQEDHPNDIWIVDSRLVSHKISETFSVKLIANIDLDENKYNVNLEKENNYDLIIDTSDAVHSDVADVILKCEKYYREKKFFRQKMDKSRKTIAITN